VTGRQNFPYGKIDVVAVNKRSSGSERKHDALPKLSGAPLSNKPTPSAAARPPELTLRALFAGCVLGAALAAANVYTALKTGYIDGGSITASVLSFAAFRVLARPASTLETNLIQTVASSAAVMSFVAGVAGPTAALARAGYSLTGGALVTWTLALAAIGIAIGVGLRARLIATEALPFPTGTATAEVIAAMGNASGDALTRARWLLITAALGAAVAWFRDGPSALLPQTIAIAGTVSGVAASALSLGISVSPLLVATGLLSGLRAGTSMLLGGMLAWLVVLPRLIASDVVPSAEHGQALTWLLWPAVALVLSSSLTALLLQWRTLAGGFADVGVVILRRNQPANDTPAAIGGGLRGLLALVMVSATLIVVIAYQVLGIAPLRTLFALALSAALAVVCARGAGETDIAPAGDMGGLMQLLFGSPLQRASSLACGGIATAQATQTAQMLWAFKAGHKLGANPRHQVLAQLLGAIVGALVVVPTYDVVARAYGIGSERLPAVSVLSWEATATAVQGGLAGLPRHAAEAAMIAFVFGSLLTLLGRTRLAPYLPSSVALGIGFLMPLSMTASLFIGALLLTLMAAVWPDWTRDHIESVAGGAIAGESLAAVVLAVLITFGVIAG
jgi:uncharacterized oligopeptide transporter (OPT) family protein